MQKNDHRDKNRNQPNGNRYHYRDFQQQHREKHFLDHSKRFEKPGGQHNNNNSQ